jgi:hypothetical protein
MQLLQGTDSQMKPLHSVSITIVLGHSLLSFCFFQELRAFLWKQRPQEIPVHRWCCHQAGYRRGTHKRDLLIHKRDLLTHKRDLLTHKRDLLKQVPPSSWVPSRYSLLEQKPKRKKEKGRSSHVYACVCACLFSSYFFFLARSSKLQCLLGLLSVTLRRKGER